eukprot:TRINITY_DN1742_c0_g1_i1.p1 TRINITY_DN1742_c0_g1~~TRINITY_DN1742_c0_g1_i1.p1  ORF type:complete len:259 (+),score=24.75 TRINITY_DN1742_c0_g1_i1:91-777(+)
MTDCKSLTIDQIQTMKLSDLCKCKGLHEEYVRLSREKEQLLSSVGSVRTTGLSATLPSASVSSGGSVESAATIPAEVLIPVKSPTVVDASVLRSLREGIPCTLYQRGRAKPSPVTLTLLPYDEIAFVSPHRTALLTLSWSDFSHISTVSSGNLGRFRTPWRVLTIFPKSLAAARIEFELDSDYWYRQFYVSVQTFFQSRQRQKEGVLHDVRSLAACQKKVVERARQQH